MGWKSIELQVAIPRSQDAGKMQEQLSRQGQQFQQTLTEQQLREDVVKRHKVNKFENVEKKSIKDEDENTKDETDQHKKDKNSSKKEKLDHPYLGKKIDFSG